MEKLNLIKKEVNAEAMLWTGNNHRDMHDFLGGNPEKPMDSIGENFSIDFARNQNGGLMIKSFGKLQCVKIGEYVVRQNHRDSLIFYSCSTEELLLNFRSK